MGAMTQPRNGSPLEATTNSLRSGKPCSVPGCPESGEYPAPVSREKLREYNWFCLEHVRAFNGSWDFYKGMSESQIEAERRRDSVWRRPSWRLGDGRYSPVHGAWSRTRDDFGLFEESAAERPDPRPRSSEAEALSVLGLSGIADMRTVKDRYIALVKQLHPDRNGGDPAHEERLKRVNQAYETLKKSFTP